MDRLKSVKNSIFIIDIFFVLLFIFTLALPIGVTWYVEAMGRSESLPSTVLLTCYPCVPFAVVILICLRRFLKCFLKDEIFSEKTVRYLHNIALCCIIIAVISCIGGNFYYPFLIVGGTFAFLSLFVMCLKSAFKSQLNP